MAKTIGWARVRPSIICALRRGAWYPVVDDDASSQVVLGVSEHLLTFPKESLQIRRHRPDRFSVVVKAPEDPNPVQGTDRDLGLTYAVCPASRSRVRLEGHPHELECPECGHHYPVAWDDVC